MKLFFIISICLLNFIFTDNMNYIIDNIYLGDKTAAKNEEFLKEYNISTVINCAEELTSVYKDIKFMELKLYDTNDQNLFPKFEVAYKYIKLHSKNNILIHCKMGASRSASLVIFYIMKEKGWDYDTSYKYTEKRRPVINPKGGFAAQLRDYYDKYIKNNNKK